MSEQNSNFVGLWITVTLLGVIFIFFLIAALVWMRTKLNREKRRLLEDMVAERERTMYTISTEIHDNVSQELNLAKMMLSVAEREGKGAKKHLLKEISIMLNNAINELGDIGHTLNSDYVKKKGIYDFLDAELNRISLTRRLHCKLEVARFTKSFEPDTELMVVRIAQEIIQNSLRHAKAQNLAVYLSYDDRLFEMKIKDDGRGFSTDKKPVGIGIQSMHNRARIIRGSIKIDSGDQGTEITLFIRNPKYIKVPLLKPGEYGIDHPILPTED